jgi:lantibiotic modifying enzyme
LSPPSRSVPWRPLAPENLHRSIDRILGDIAGSLWEGRASLTPDLATGLPGAALFFVNLASRPGFPEARERALSLLEASMAAAEDVTDPSLYLGLSGIAWSMEQTYRTFFAEAVEDYNADMDALLMDLLASERWGGHHDVSSGLAGLGVYALERMPRPSAEGLLLRILDHLEAAAMVADGGLAWLTPPSMLPEAQRASSPAGHFDLGAAHGVPGILAVLAAMASWHLAPGRVGPLLRAGLAWFRRWVESPAFHDGLPVWIVPGGEPPKGSRIAWCYGDLGSAVALMDAESTITLRLGRRAASRPVSASRVRDASLCHGSAGNLHLFNRLHQHTGDAEFAAAALRYLDVALASCAPGRPFAGVTAYVPDPEMPETPSLQVAPGLLEGAAGVGLALLASLGGPAPEWDRAFLAGLPVGAGR